MRKTSIDAYHQIKEDGTLTKKQQEVYNYLKVGGPTTARQLSKAIPGAWKRLSELCEMGCVIGITTIKDPITGKEVTEWRATDNKPIKIPKIKKPSYTELEKELERFKNGITTGALYDAAYLDGYKDGLVAKQIRVEIFGAKDI